MDASSAFQLLVIIGLPLSSLTENYTCKTTAQADIMLLVDGSYSVGMLNFQTIRTFISHMVDIFEIGPDRVQIGLVQYAGAPLTEWHLNTHKTRTELLRAVADLPYRGGNTMTGLALNYILQTNFKASVGMREKSSKMGVLITDGRSQDDIIFSSQNLRDQGIEMYAIGVKNAYENELRLIVSDPEENHMYLLKDFNLLINANDIITNICNSVKCPGETFYVTIFPLIQFLSLSPPPPPFLLLCSSVENHIR
ncbi:collagen alpha-1(XII) chain-like [Alosa pseudoharengus]|uniref:collagen alpha-1(XII) chain-like n=1 Tax=Alosa pseudoharengus TaxID=34774 RepID=UPI003F892931